MVNFIARECNVYIIYLPFICSYLPELAETMDLPAPSRCCRCHITLALERCQTFDMLAMCVDVIEHYVYAVGCVCGLLHYSSFPAERSACWRNTVRTCALWTYI